MQVRMKIGPKAGEIVDVVYHAARTLVEGGQAEDVHDHMRLPKAKVIRIDEVVVGAKVVEPATEPVVAGVDVSMTKDATVHAFADPKGNKKKRK